MRIEYETMETAMKCKLVENQQKASQQNEQMQKALNKQKSDIDLVMELNESLKTNKERLQQKNEQLKQELEKEKDKRREFVDSLNAKDTDKVRTS